MLFAEACNFVKTQLGHKDKSKKPAHQKVNITRTEMLHSGESLTSLSVNSVRRVEYEQWQILPDTAKEYWTKLREGERADVNAIPKLLWDQMNTDEQKKYLLKLKILQDKQQDDPKGKRGENVSTTHKANMSQVLQGDIEEEYTSDYLEYLRAINNTATEREKILCGII